MEDTSTGTEAAPSYDPGIVPSDERDEILREIEESVRLGRSTLEAAGPAGARGFALPAFVNIGALVLVALAVIIVPRLYDVSERRLVDPAAGSAEAAGLFRALRQEADVQIQEREAEIENLQEQYGKVRAEREELRRGFDAKLKSRADELQAELQRAIDAEKRRLSETGLNDTATDAKVRDLEARLQAERNSELEAYGAKLQAESAQRERELAAAQTRFGEELRMRTDPLAAEIERLTAQGQAQQAAQKDLTRRYDESQAELRRLEAGLKRVTAERDDASAALRRDLQDSMTTVARLRQSEASLRRELQESIAVSDRLQKAEAANLEIQERLAAMLRRFPAAGARPAEDPTTLATRLDLLEAKVEARSIIASGPVLASHPDLAAKLDRFFIESEAAYRAEGRRAGLAEAIEIVDSLAERRDPGGSAAGDPDFRRFIERLQLLLR